MIDKPIRIGLNGFGRIGRAFSRIALDDPHIEIVAINTSRSAPDMLSHLLQYDSVYRTYHKKVTSSAMGISVDSRQIHCYNYQDPYDIPWNNQLVNVVIDCTGIFKTRQELSKHLRGSVSKVLLSAPSSDKTIPHVVLGVNDDTFQFDRADIISNASCTTNCAAVMLKVLHDALHVKSGSLTTIHAYTSSQQLLDGASKDFTKARSAPLSIIPSTTGAAKSVEKVIPELAGKLDGVSVRVPTPTGSYTDLSCIVETPTTKEHINELFKEAAEKKLSHVLSYSTVPLVSADFIGSPYSCIFDANYTNVLPHNLVKLFGWYDNEWGYSSRLVDLVKRLF